MKVSTEIDNNFGYEKITQLVDNIPLIFTIHNIEFHTQREITRVYNSSQKSHIL
jgi:hypothetical protein